MSKPVRNVLFIMCDQLRWDYLSCYGHPHLHTPNIDRLAARGVRFNRAYVQSPICGSSRMSFYTGRYVHSHGASWNGIPLDVGEWTLGDYMRQLGRETVLVGKTHMRPDHAGLERLGIPVDSTVGVRASECGFDPWDRDDGLHGLGPDGRYDPQLPRYNDYLREHGFEGENPWHSWANAVVDDKGKVRSGFLLDSNRFPCRLPEEHTETPYMTRRAMDFMTQRGDDPWCMHLSYIKPHWPCVAPAPYHAMYGSEHVLPAVRNQSERENAHPIYEGFMAHRISVAFASDELRDTVIPAYMGLIKQIDDQLGVLFDHMQDMGLLDHTLIAFTSDHGDYLGDHWMGEKDLFHEPSVRVPMLIVDPRPEADSTRGTTSDAMIESIDLVPTFVQACGGKTDTNRLDGLSLVPQLHGSTVQSWREHIFSEYDYTVTPTGVKIGNTPSDSRLFMVFDGRYKYIHAIGLPPMLYDLEEDPDELVDLGRSEQHNDVIERLHHVLGEWALRFSQRGTRTDAEMLKMRGASMRKGILIGYVNETDLEDDLREHLEQSLHT